MASVLARPIASHSSAFHPTSPRLSSQLAAGTSASLIHSPVRAIAPHPNTDRTYIFVTPAASGSAPSNSSSSSSHAAAAVTASSAHQLSESKGASAATTMTTVANSAWNYFPPNSTYSLPLTPNIRNTSNGEVYTTNNPPEPYLTPGSNPPTPSPPAHYGMELSRGNSMGSTSFAMEGASAGLRLFPQSTVYAPRDPMTINSAYAYQSRVPLTPGAFPYNAALSSSPPHPSSAAGSAAATYPGNLPALPVIPTTPNSNQQLPPTIPTPQQAARKRMRPEQWNGSTTTPGGAAVAAQEHESNLVPPSLLNLYTAATSTTITPSTDNTPTTVSSLANNVHIHTNLESIQASLNSLHAVQYAQTKAATKSEPPLPVVVAPAYPPAMRKAVSLDSTPTSTSSVASTPTTSATPTVGVKRGASGKAIPSNSRSKSEAPAAPPQLHSQGSSQDIKTQADSGSDKEHSPSHTPTPGSQPNVYPDGDTSRKSKHRLIEKQRRDELKKNMELLSSLVKYTNPTNKNGVAMAAIAYLQEQRALLEAERIRVKDLELLLAETQKKLRDTETLHRACASNASSENTSVALVPHYSQPTVSMAKYQTLLNQFHEMQMSYSELANLQSVKSLVQNSPYLFGNNGAAAAANANGKAMKKLMSGSSPSFQGNSGANRPSSPFSPSDFNAAAHAEIMGEMEQPHGLPPLTPNGPETTFGFATPSAGNPSGGFDASQMLSAALKNGGGLPFTASLLFNSESTSRLLTRDGIIIEASPQMLRDLGYERDELIGMPINDITPSIKQPMTRLVSGGEHESEPCGILNSYKTKKGGVIFRYGLLERVWDVAKCPGKPGHSHSTSNHASSSGPSAGASSSAAAASSQSAAASSDGTAPTIPTLELLTPSTTNSDATGSSGNTVQPISVNPGFCNSAAREGGECYFTPCKACGQRPRFGLFTGCPTYYNDMHEYLMLSVKAAIRLFDSEIKPDGLEIDEFFTRGKVTYETTQINSAGNGYSTVKVTKFLPMRFVQAVAVYENMARTASATKSNPPMIQL